MQIFCHIRAMIVLPNFKAVNQVPAELCILKIKKTGCMYKTFFTNSIAICLSLKFYTLKNKISIEFLGSSTVAAGKPYIPFVYDYFIRVYYFLVSVINI